MRREWTPEELIECWTLVEGDWALVANKAGATRLGFAVMLKFFELEGRFPRHGGEVPRAVVEYLAAQVKVPAELFGEYQWSGRTIEYHRAQVRKALGFREATVGDEDQLVAWLAEEVCPVELSEDRLREALAARCRVERVEPPAPGGSIGWSAPRAPRSSSASPPWSSPGCRSRPSPGSKRWWRSALRPAATTASWLS